MKAICIIPARGGSKRIPNKNIRDFCGKPIIAYSIETALESGLFERVIVSTDSEAIAEVAILYGAEVPFMRPAELADDFATTGVVVRHALEFFREAGEEYDIVYCVYATAPFLQLKYLQEGYKLLTDLGAPAAYTVATFPAPIFRARKINERGELEMIWPDKWAARSQDLPDAYMDAGQFYCARTKPFLKHGRFSMAGVRPINVPRYLVQDIDTEEDWRVAEFHHKALSLEQTAFLLPPTIS